MQYNSQEFSRETQFANFQVYYKLVYRKMTANIISVPASLSQSIKENVSKFIEPEQFMETETLWRKRRKG